MIDFQSNVDSHEGRLTLSGDLTIDKAGELKATLINALVQVDHIIINLEKATAIDVSVLQLLWALKEALAQHKKQCTIIQPIAKVVEQTVAKIGMKLF